MVDTYHMFPFEKTSHRNTIDFFDLRSTRLTLHMFVRAYPTPLLPFEGGSCGNRAIDLDGRQGICGTAHQPLAQLPRLQGHGQVSRQRRVTYRSDREHPSVYVSRNRCLCPQLPPGVSRIAFDFAGARALTASYRAILLSASLSRGRLAKRSKSLTLYAWLVSSLPASLIVGFDRGLSGASVVFKVRT